MQKISCKLLILFTTKNYNGENNENIMNIFLTITLKLTILGLIFYYYMKIAYIIKVVSNSLKGIRFLNACNYNLRSCFVLALESTPIIYYF